jgi:putative tryptophan/tyrosine transport system substrate-binding protein
VRTPQMAAHEPWNEALRAGLREQGLREDETVAIVVRYTDGTLPGISATVERFIREGASILCANTSQVILAARRVTRTVPIVMAGVSDPVRIGLIDSLARPGGNVTGVSITGPELLEKRLELMREMMPGLSRLGVLVATWDPGGPVYARFAGQVGAALGLAVVTRFVDRSAERVLAAVGELARENVDAIFAQPIFIPFQADIAEVALRHRRPVFSDLREAATAGCVFSYGPNYRDVHRRAARYIAQILAGAQPHELPVEQSSILELVINLRVARALGLNVSPALLARADEVIE